MIPVMKKYEMPDGTWRWLIIDSGEVVASGVSRDGDSAYAEGSAKWMELYGDKHAGKTAVWTGLKDMFGNIVDYEDALEWIGDESVDWQVASTIGDYVQLVPYGTSLSGNPSVVHVKLEDFATDIINREYGKQACCEGEESNHRYELFQTDERDWVFMPFDWALAHGFDFVKGYIKVCEGVYAPESSSTDLSDIIRSISDDIRLYDPTGEGRRPIGQSDIIRIDDEFYYLQDEGAVRIERKYLK